MLAITRHPGERVRLMTSDGPIWIEIASVRGRRITLGIDAPQSVRIEREERIGTAKADAPDPEIEEDLRQLTTSPHGEEKRGAF